MKMNPNKILFFINITLLSLQLSAQERILIHSHNDYERRVPFYQAYAQQVASIEADVFEENGQLLVAHELHQLKNAHTIDDLYLNPIVNLFNLNGGKPWKDSNNTLILLIDLKTSATPALDILIKKLEEHPTVFDPSKNPYAVRVVISGSRPEPKNFYKYATVVNFDGEHLKYTAKELERISMISLSLKELTDWNGKGILKKDHQAAVQKKIKAVHALGKPIRFWATPDGINAWNLMYNMGIDYINTDEPEACAKFFSNFQDKNFQINGDPSEIADEIKKYKRLDKVTVGFQGFNNKLLQLSKGIEVYQPSYKNDGAKKTIKNIIFLIGDGAGINQLQAAATVNNPKYINGMGLSIFNMKYLGFQNTSSQDSYTTDSAAAGSALATGVIHDNRHISMSNTGIPNLSITDYMYDAGYASGVITLGNLADATPAAFYGHSRERDNTDQITTSLLNGKLTLLNGAGMQVFAKRQDGKDILSELKKQYRISTDINDINADNQKVICVDESMDLAASEKTLDLLANATRQGIKKLTKTNKKGFFLMVEGAKIDYAGHANSLPGSIVETFSFDLAVAEALKFADSNGETLVVVTGDHETGGLTFIDADFNTGHVTAHHTTNDHTAQMLPVFAYGPGAQEFIGVYKNTEVFNKIFTLMGFKNK